MAGLSGWPELDVVMEPYFDRRVFKNSDRFVFLLKKYIFNEASWTRFGLDRNSYNEVSLIIHGTETKLVKWWTAL